MKDEQWHELRKKVMYANDIDEEIEAWEEIDRRLKQLDKIKEIQNDEDIYPYDLRMHIKGVLEDE